jgi:hypothetical protein
MVKTINRSIDDGLVLYLPLNEGVESKIYDRSQYTNNGNVIGTVADVWASTKDGMPFVTFDGADDYIEVPQSTDFTPAVGTLALFLKVIALTMTHETYFFNGNGASWPNLNRTIKRNSDTQRFQFVVTDQISQYKRLNIPTDFTLGQWYHLAMTFDATTITGYVDGRQILTDTTGFTIASDSQIARIGRASTNNYPSQCACYEVRMYNRILSNKEIRELSEMRRRL